MTQRGIVLPPFALQVLLYVGCAAVAAGLLWGVYKHIEGKGYDRGIAECHERAQAQREAETKQGNAASTALEQKNEKTRVIYKTIERKVDRIVAQPVYRDSVCLEPVGLQLANDALAGPRSVAGKLDRTLPGSDAARGRDGGERAP